MAKIRCLLLSIILAISCSANAQKVSLYYYQDDKKAKTKNVEVFVVTKLDTIKLEKRNGSVSFPEMKENFTLFVEVDSEKLKLGSFRPVALKSFQKIIAGNIKDFSQLRYVTGYNDSFIIDNLYPITISNWKNAAETVYGILVRNEEVENGLFRLTNFGVSNIKEFK